MWRTRCRQRRQAVDREDKILTEETRRRQRRQDVERRDKVETQELHADRGDNMETDETR